MAPQNTVVDIDSDSDSDFSDGSDFEAAIDSAIDSATAIESPALVITNNNNENGNTNTSAEIDFNLNYDSLDTIVYPTNLPVREYQYDIVMKALFSNLLCAIPTGLGKTFIAATLMLNFYRWTSSAMKIIFMAPTRPLVAQQIKAFLQISGISISDTDILLDKLKRNRKLIWDSKRVFFATPQVVENDLKTGILDPHSVSLVIIDEAHRATGNYAYSNVVKFITRFNSRFRVLALTATPGSDMEAIQNVVTNLNISTIEIKTESDPMIKKYIKDKEIDKLDCGPTPEITECIELISSAIAPVLEKANSQGIYDIRDPAKINHFVAMEKSRQISTNKNIPEGQKWAQFFMLQLLGTVGRCLRRLNIYGVKTFYAYFIEKHTEFTTKFDNKKSTNKLAASFYYHENITAMMRYVEKTIADDKAEAEKNKHHIEGVFSHSKLEHLVDELVCFFSKPTPPDMTASSCIVFTEYRESALEIVRVLNNANKSVGKELLRPHIFIGQSKEKDKFDQQGYLDKIKPKRKRGKASTTTTTIEPAKKTTSKSTDRPTDRMGSSEMAQTKGMTQKTQKELIDNFKSGEHNILVATSIGEEGLDIGEVDLIVCFDSTQSPIKNIQRMGRTGRKRDGRVLLLFSSNERSKFESAMGKYEWIQSQISDPKANTLEFFNPRGNRIMPDGINPVVEKRFVEIVEENKGLLEDADIVDDDEFLKLATQTVKKGGGVTKGKKNQKLSTPATKGGKQMKIEKRFFMPKNVKTGFKPASSFIKKVDGKSVKPGVVKKSNPDPITTTTTTATTATIAVAPVISSFVKPITKATESNNTSYHSIDLTNDSDSSDNSDCEEISIVKVTPRDTDISGNAGVKVGVPDPPTTDKVNIDFDEFSDDELSDISLGDMQIVRNTGNFSLSSDPLSDGIDEADLMAQIEQQERQAAKRLRMDSHGDASVDEEDQRPAKR